MKGTVSILDGDPVSAEALRRLLAGGGYLARSFATPGRFFDSLLSGPPDAVFLRLDLPGMDGKDIIRVLRSDQATRRVRVVALSSGRGEDPKAVDVFQAGADEYFRGAVEPDLLLARLGSLLRRIDPLPQDERLKLGELEALPEQRLCRLGGKDIPLTRIEFDLLVHFLRQRERVLTRGALLQSIWGDKPSSDMRTVDKHVEILRKKLGAFGRRLSTVFRVGYVLR